MLSQFGEQSGEARKRYIDFVNDGGKEKMWDDVVSGIVLGGKEFAGQCRLLAHGDGDINEVPREQRYINRPDLAELLGGVEAKGEKWLRAVEEYGYTQKEVAKQCRVHYSYVSKMLKRERSKVKT